MGVADIRAKVQEARDHAAAQDTAVTVAVLDELLRALEPDNLLTTTEAAALLGIRSVNTLKAIVRRYGLPTEMHGNRMMIPLRALEMLQNYPDARLQLDRMRTSDRIHETMGGGELSPEELAGLEAGRSGCLPWKVGGHADTDSRGR